MANDVLYEVRITLPVDGQDDPAVFRFRSDLPIEQATDLARSLWLSTSNRSMAVSVVVVGGIVPCITFRSRE